MRNEFGVPLDRNGYAPSLLSGFRRCYLCWRTSCKLDRHECFPGPFRQKSKALGLWCLLCPDCHTGPHGVHRDAERAVLLKREAQSAAMEAYGWTVDEFREKFGKNFLEDS